jgi:hypothetical protein
MRAICIDNTTLKHLSITAGKEYHVLGIAMWESDIELLVDDDASRPGFIPLDLLSIVDSRLPDDWIFGSGEHAEFGRWARWGYERFATEFSHYEDLIERVPDALRCFEVQAKHYREKYPHDLRVVVKSIYVEDKVPLKSFFPENKDCFGAWVFVQIGPDIEKNDFVYQILVCTPNWIERKYQSLGAVWGRHMLIVFQYDPKHIQSEIEKYVAQRTGKSFWEIAQKISRVGVWEFEDD